MLKVFSLARKQDFTINLFCAVTDVGFHQILEEMSVVVK